jgi:hypothetical protein
MDEFLLNFFPTVYEKKHMAINTDYCKYDNQLLQLFTSSLYIAGLCAAFPDHVHGGHQFFCWCNS